MAKKRRSPILDLLVYLVVRLAVGVLQALPVTMGNRLGQGFAWLAYHVDKRHREVARENLRHAFPERCADPAECDRLVRGCYRHFCLMFIEMMYLPRKLHAENWRKFSSIVGSGIPDVLIHDRPALMVTAHFGNWEMAGFAVGLLGFRSYAIARPLDNPHLERFFKQFRQKTGQTLLAKKGDFENITAAMAEGGKLATLGDQDAGERGLFVPFFHRPASTHKAIALLALQHHAVMAVFGVPRIGKMLEFEIVTEDVIDTSEYAQRPDAVRAITERYTQALERLIRRYPEQYFWLHRRWKHQPSVRKTKQAA